MTVGSDTTQWQLSGVANGGAIWQKSNSAAGGSDDRYLRLGNVDNNGTPNYVMTIFNSNVGIGTTSPQTILHINSPASTNATIYFGVNGTMNGYLGQAATAASLSSGAAIGDVVLRSQTNLIFTSNGDTERMRINTSGTIVLPSNQLTPSLNANGLILQGYATNNSWVSDNLYYSNNSAAFLRASTGFVAQIYFAGGKIETHTAGSDTAGSIITRIAGPYLTNGGTSWTNSSDIRKKKNFEPTQGLAELLQIETIKYNLITEEDGTTKRLGFKAQNIQTLIPEMVMETSEKAEDGSHYLGLTQDYILPVLVKAIQELKAEIDILKQQ
jgi:hypothetical protein